MRATVLRWLYRIVAPRHPRGWLDVQAVYKQDAEPTTMWVHCHGMERWNLPNVEFVGVPLDLGGYAHGLMFEIVGYMKNEKPIGPDENLGGLLVSEDQPAIHYATARHVSRLDDPAHDGFLRFVDFEQPLEAGFPFRLFAAHLCALGMAAGSPEKAESMLQRAIEIFPHGPTAEMPPEQYEEGSNPNNWAVWLSLGLSLCSQERLEEGIECFKEAVARYPAGARAKAKQIRADVAEGTFIWPADAPEARFWTELDVDAVRREVLTKYDRESQITR